MGDICHNTIHCYGIADGALT